MTLSNKYHISSVYSSVRLVTDLIIQATLNGCYSNWVKRKLALSGTDEVTGNVLHRSDWYVESVGPCDWGHPNVLKGLFRIISSTNFNAQFNNTRMSHYYPRHVSGLDMPILRRNNCTNTASGILALLNGCTLHRLRAESALKRCSVQPLRRARIPDAVFVHLFLLRMGMSRPETCRG